MKLYTLSVTGFFCIQVSRGVAASLVIPASNEWAGPDGPWSFFELYVGPDLRKFPAFPAMTLPIYVISQTQECMMDFSSETCKSQGPYSYDIAMSTTLELLGSYDLPGYTNFSLFNQPSWGYYGTDTVILNKKDSGLQFTNQLTAMLETDNTQSAFIGLAAGNAATSSRVFSTPLDALRMSNKNSTSRSYSYTAGSYNRQRPASLIIGGYYISRFDSSTTVEYPVSSIGASDLTVVISFINLHTNSTLGDQLIFGETLLVKVDAAIPHIWLPSDICEGIAQAFELTWNEDEQLYLINQTTHQNNLQRNTSITFSFTDSVNKDMNFTLPYSAFNLEIHSNAKRYFPLKPANSSEQYMLGRAFLQEAYIIVDHDRHIFSISQATFGDDPHIVDIGGPQNSTTNSTTSSTTSSMTRHKITTATWVGIGIGVTATLLLLGVGAVVWHRRFKKKREPPKTEPQDRFDKSELHGQEKPRLELIGNSRLELEVTEPGHEISGSQLPPAELEGCKPLVYELHH